MAEKRIEPGPLTRQLAQSIQRTRKAQGLTYAQLAERLTQAGRPIPALGLSRMEQGDRRIDVDDLAAIAQALRVPPVWLLFPLGQEGDRQVELLPGVRVPAEAALDWFAGDADAFADHFGRGSRNADSGLYQWYELPEGIEFRWVEDVRPLWLYREHRRCVLEWYQIWSRSARAQETAAKPAGAVLFALAGLVEENLRAIRNEMRRLDLPLPRLPEGGLRDRFEPQGGDSGGKEDRPDQAG